MAASFLAKLTHSAEKYDIIILSYEIAKYNTKETCTIMQNYLDTDDKVFRVTNIRFEKADGSDATKNIYKINPEESSWIECNPHATSYECELSYVRSRLVFGMSSAEFDYEPLYHGPEYKEILTRHDCFTHDQPWTADDSDCENKPNETGECYMIEFPTEWYCVMPQSSLSIIDVILGDKKKYDEIVEHLIDEYIRATLPITFK